MQRAIQIGEIIIPVIEEGSELWYPISFIGNKVLLKNLSPLQLKKNGYEGYIKEFEIDYGDNTGGVQNTYCISRNGLKIILNNSKIGRLNIDQKKAMNKVLEYLGMELIIEDNRFIKILSKKEILKYPEFIQDCIQDVLNDNPNIIWQRCSKCNNYYPYHTNFFRENPHPGNEYPLYTVCRECKWTGGRGKDYIKRNSSKLSGIYRRLGLDTYKLYKNKDVIGIYNDWLEKRYTKSFPSGLKTKENFLIIIKYLYDVGKITKENLTLNYLKDQFRLDSISISLNQKEIYEFLFKDNPINYPWKYPKFLLPQDMEFNQYQTIFNNYLYSKNIKIEYIYEFNYLEVCNACGLKKYVNHDILSFIVKYHNYQFPGYKFKQRSENYWKCKENRNFDLKWLVENDMKISVEKIPLYLTLENLRKNSNTLRTVVRNYYKNNLWKWVNEIYPNKFIEEDFNITVVRNVFDSAEEHVVHDILKNKFSNVIYNQRNTENTITINHMQPDWFVFTDNGVWVVEYFGIAPQEISYNNAKVDYYKKKTLSKIERYKTMKWLGKIYVYPDDLKKNFKGLEDKLKDIV